MSKSTVLQFATELKLPVYALLEQLAKAGVDVANSTDALSDSDKGKLLDYLRQQQGSTTTTKITLTRKKSTEVIATNPHGRQHVVQVQVRKQLKVPRSAVLRKNTELTSEQLEFLDRIGVPMSRVFNSEGMGQVECGRAMKALGKWIAFGVSPCGAKGHTLKTRKWHCIQCHPENLSYLRRHDEEGHVYVAYSFSKKLTKVGTAKDSADRIRNLNSYRYGGASDWRRCFAIHCNGAGKVESMAQQTLTSYSATGTYFKDGATISCQELFDCDVAVAVDAVNKAVVAAKCEPTIVQKHVVNATDGSYTKAAGTFSVPERTQQTHQRIYEKIEVGHPASQSPRIPEGRQLSDLSPEQVSKLKAPKQQLIAEHKAASSLPDSLENLPQDKQYRLRAIFRKAVDEQKARDSTHRQPIESCLDYDWPGKFRPFKHQIQTTEFLVQHHRSFCLSDMGCGKTASVLWAFDHLQKQKTVQRMLVVSPLSTLQRTWGDEISGSFGLRYMVLVGSGEERRKKLREKADIYIINHDGLKVPGMVDAINARDDIDMIVVDEIAQAARTASSERWKCLARVVRHEILPGLQRRAIGLTGTPTPNTPTDAWAQCRLIVPERVPAYFNSFKNQVMQQVGYMTWVPKPEAIKVVAEAMQPSIRFKREECIDLPPVTYQTREVPLTAEQSRLYREMLIRLRAELANGQITAVNELVKANKLLQIAAGAAYKTDGDTAYITPQDRLEVTEEIIEEASGSIIVFVPFRGALDAVAKHLKDKGLSIGVIHGGVTSKERDRVFHEFQKTKNIRVLVAQPASMAHGLNLTAANTIIWFGPLYNNEIYQQSCARITRPGQVRKQLIVHIQGCPAERRVYSRLREKEQVQGLLLELLEDLRDN